MLPNKLFKDTLRSNKTHVGVICSPRALGLRPCRVLRSSGKAGAGQQEARAEARSAEPSRGRQLLPPETPGRCRGGGLPRGVPGVSCQQPACSCAGAPPSGAHLSFGKNKPRGAAGGPNPARPRRAAPALWWQAGSTAALGPWRGARPLGSQVLRNPGFRLEAPTSSVCGPRVHSLIIILGSQHSHTLIIGPRQ